MKLPHSSKEAEALLRTLVPRDDDVSLRPMFGNVSAFVGGNMFMGAYGEDLFVRLPEADRDELLKNEGASVFEPMAGRQMKEYIVFPRAWRSDPSKMRPWASKSMVWAKRLPAKAAKAKKGKGKR